MNDFPYDAAAHQMELEARQQTENSLKPIAAYLKGVSAINVNDVFPSKYLKASDLQGRTVKVQIDTVAVEEIGKDRKPVLMFTGKQKGLVLNKSNAQIIASVYSPETNGWIGRDIELRPDKVAFNGQMVDCIRVQIPAPPADDFNDDPGF